jgi:hypothetical protein
MISGWEEGDELWERKTAIKATATAAQQFAESAMNEGMGLAMNDEKEDLARTSTKTTSSTWQNLLRTHLRKTSQKEKVGSCHRTKIQHTTIIGLQGLPTSTQQKIRTKGIPSDQSMPPED